MEQTTITVNTVPNETKTTKVASKQINKNWLITGFAVLMVLIVGGVIIAIATGKPTNSATMLPANTCPDSIDLNSGRPTAIYLGRPTEMSAETYAWVQANCKEEYADPVITNLGVKFADYDINTGRAGDFIFDRSILNTNLNGNNKIFFEFGSTLTQPDGSKKIFPEIIYNQLDTDTDVTALAAGKVVEVTFQPTSNDYAVGVLVNGNWAVVHDHVREVTVQVNNNVTAGQILGKVAINRDGQTGYTEIQVKDQKGASYCPLKYLPTDLQTVYSGYISKLISDWEMYMADTGIYNETAMTLPGCLAETYTEK